LPKNGQLKFEGNGFILPYLKQVEYEALFMWCKLIYFVDYLN